MLCHFYSFASFVMWVLCCPLVETISIKSNNNSSANQVNHDMYKNNFNITINTNYSNSVNDTEIQSNDDLIASPTQLVSWIRTSSGDYVNEKLHNNSNLNKEYNNNKPNDVRLTNSSRASNFSVKRLLDVLKNDNRRDDDLGLPPDIAHEYIDAVNPPKFRIPVHYGAQHYDTSSVSPLNQYLNRVHAGSSVISTKLNYSIPVKPNLPRNTGIDLAELLKAELDAKNIELDNSNGYTSAPNLFALLPGGVKADNPFIESNYKEPNRLKSTTPRPYVIIANNNQLNQYKKENEHKNDFNSNDNNMRPPTQFVYGEGLPFNVINPLFKPTITITTPHSISIISTRNPAKVAVLRSSTTIRPVISKVKIKTFNIASTTTTSTTTTTKTPTISISTTIASNAKQNKSSDWSLRVNNQSIDGSSDTNDSNDLRNQINGNSIDDYNHSQEPYITDNKLNKNNNKVITDDYETSTQNKTEYSYFDYADNTLHPNYTMPDGFAEYPGASYRLTTERLAYILIGSCCALSVLCLIVVAMSVRCRDMCDEYRSWKKAEKAAMRWQRHQYRLAHHQQDLSRYFRTSVDANQETRPGNSHIGSSAPAPMFGTTCCHCINCSSSWLFRDVNKNGRDWCCQRGYYHPAPRGKLPFGAASSVNTFMPRYANNTNTNNYCDDVDDTDSLNASELIDNHHISHHNRQRDHQFSERPLTPSGNSRHNHNQRHQQLRRIAQPNGNPNWIQSSEIVDEIHKKHCNINHISRDQLDQQNMNNLRRNNREHFNDNIVVWNNNNDERLI